MATPSKGLDRRAERTRTLIRQAFIEAASEKSLSAVSIQDITDRANVSRGTFYAHYADKYALIDVIMREDFQRMVSALSLPSPSAWDKNALHRLIRGVLDYFQKVYQRHQRERDIAPLLENVIHEELYTLILAWLKQSPQPEARPQISSEMLAQLISWAIFGAALHWSREDKTLSVEAAAGQILNVILDGVAAYLREGFAT